MKDSPNAFILTYLLKRTYPIRRNQLVVPLGHKLFLFYQLLCTSKQFFEDSPRSSWTPPPPLLPFQEYITELEAKVELSKVTGGVRKPRSKYNKKEPTYTQPGASATHFPVAEEILKNRPDWFVQRLKKKCPFCSHDLLSIVQTNRQIFDLKEAIKKEFDFEVSRWKAGGSVGPKPKMTRKVPEQMVVCMCCVQNCVDPSTGKGCNTCQAMVAFNGKPDWDDQKNETNCEKCKCPCRAYFPFGKWTDVAVFAEQKKKGEEKVKNEAKEEQEATQAGKFGHRFNTFKTRPISLKFFYESYHFVFKEDCWSI